MVGKSAQGRIEISHLGRDYLDGKRTLTVLDDVNFSVSPGEFVTITGPSGSGKSTLLGLLAGLDRSTRGRVQIDDVDLGDLSEDELAAFRGQHIGFIFQSFQLIPTLTALENVRVPAELARDSKQAARAETLLERVGLKDRLHHFPNQLSGGEMQRVAIARATINQPKVLLADEPTGNLDTQASNRVLDLLAEANRGATLVLVTHDLELAARANREIRLRDGKIADVIQHRPLNLENAGTDANLENASTDANLEDTSADNPDVAQTNAEQPSITA